MDTNEPLADEPEEPSDPVAELLEDFVQRLHDGERPTIAERAFAG